VLAILIAICRFLIYLRLATTNRHLLRATLGEYCISNFWSLIDQSLHCQTLAPPDVIAPEAIPRRERSIGESIGSHWRAWKNNGSDAAVKG
jgi:hypothetical protein